MQSQKNSPRTFSFEFFPPNTAEGTAKLRADRKQLAQLKPRVLLGHLRRGRLDARRTLETVLDIRASRPRGGAAYLLHRFVARTEASARSRALQERTASATSSRCAATCRRASRRRASSATRTSSSSSSARSIGDHFHIEVAAYPEYHPQARNAQEDLQNFKRKVEAGADSAITQYFFNADAYYHFIDECEAMGISVPIVPGIMPIGRFSQLARFSDACGAEIPRWIRNKLEGLRRRHGVDPRVRAGRRHPTVRRPPPQRRAGTALLHAQPGRAHHHDLAAARPVDHCRAGTLATNSISIRCCRAQSRPRIAPHPSP